MRSCELEHVRHGWQRSYRFRASSAIKKRRLSLSSRKLPGLLFQLTRTSKKAAEGVVPSSTKKMIGQSRLSRSGLLLVIQVIQMILCQTICCLWTLQICSVSGCLSLFWRHVRKVANFYFPKTLYSLLCDLIVSVEPMAFHSTFWTKRTTGLFLYTIHLTVYLVNYTQKV